ncbi:MAG: type IV secretion system DNA-binding domain-containing protein [Candidatus Spechtbacterales bacterium]
MDQINYFGQINFRGLSDRFGIKIDDRRRHAYVIGKTGMGKTAMIQNMAVQDIINGNGVGIIDPHGEFAEALLNFIPEERIKDVVYFNPADYDAPIGLNLLEDVGYDKRHLVASALMGVFKKIWVDAWSARMEYILNNTILALLEYPDATLLDVNRMMANKNFRKEVLSHVQDPIVKAFWTEEFAKYGDRLAAEATASIQNKVGQFTTAPLIRNIIGQKESTIDIRKAMDEKKIIIFNLSKGRIGEDNSRLLGAMAITKIYLSAMSRIDVLEDERQDFYLYVDEFQNFASEAFEGILSEARKYRLCLIIAHQYIAQMNEEIRDAVFGNIGTFVVFRVGAEDAEYVEKEFAPQFAVEDFVNLSKYHIVLKLMIDGVTSRAFTAKTLTPFSPQEISYVEEILKSSRETYGTSREAIEESMAEWGLGGQRAKQAALAASGKAQETLKEKTEESAISLKDAREKFPPPNSKKGPSEQHQPKKHTHDSSSKNTKEDDNHPRSEHKPKPKPKNKKKQVDREGLRDLLKDIGVK